MLALPTRRHDYKDEPIHVHHVGGDVLTRPCHRPAIRVGKNHPFVISWVLSVSEQQIIFNSSTS